MASNVSYLFISQIPYTSTPYHTNTYTQHAVMRTPSTLMHRKYSEQVSELSAKISRHILVLDSDISKGLSRNALANMRSLESPWHYPELQPQVNWFLKFPDTPVQWRHNEHDGVSNHLCLDSSLNYLFRRSSKKASKLRVTGLCQGNSPVTDESPSQRASNTENVAIRWRRHTMRSVGQHFESCHPISENRYSKL